MSSINQTQTIETLNLASTQGLSEVSTQDLESTLSISVLSEYDDQIAQISENLQAGLEKQEELKNELTTLSEISSRDSTEIDGSDYIEISTDEVSSLESKGLTTISSDEKSYVLKEDLETLISEKQQEMNQLNLLDEETTLSIQTLTGKRKLLLTLLSNLIATHFQNMLHIAGNLKI